MEGSTAARVFATLSLLMASVVATPTAVGLLLVAVLLGACQHSSDTRGLSRMKVQAGGVRIAYRLAPGTALAGHMRLGQTRQIDGLSEPLSQAVECDVTLVAAPQRAGAPQRWGASFANIDMAWGLPPSSSFASEDFRGRALDLAEKYQGWIDIDPQGRVLAISPPPERVAPELARFLRVLMDAVEASFVPAPEGAVQLGTAWERRLQRPSLEGEIQATLRGYYRHKKRSEPVALLAVKYREERKAQLPTGVETRGRQGKARVLYATEGGYVAEVDRELSAFAPSLGMSYEKLRVTWEIGRVLGPPPSDRDEDVQMISDPCNPDYVGPKLCAPATVPADGDAAPATPETAAPETAAPETAAPVTKAGTGAGKPKTLPSTATQGETPPSGR